MEFDPQKGLDLLEKQLGKPYIFGYEVKLDDPDPKAFDCSELVEWFFKQMGADVPDGSWHQYTQSNPVSDFKLFDLGFLLKNGKTPFHVFIRVSETEIIHARGEQYGVTKDLVEQYVVRNKHLFSGWRRARCLM